jgi:hypothetical protein
VTRWLRRHPIAVSALATAIAACGALLIADITGAEAVGRAFEHVHPEWLGVIAFPEKALRFRGYVACGDV